MWRLMPLSKLKLMQKEKLMTIGYKLLAGGGRMEPNKTK